MVCDDEIIPLQARMATAADDADLEEVYNTERHLLYVACTRARDHLIETGVDPPSESLKDLCRCGCVSRLDGHPLWTEAIPHDGTPMHRRSCVHSRARRLMREGSLCMR